MCRKVAEANNRIGTVPHAVAHLPAALDSQRTLGWPCLTTVPQELLAPATVSSYPALCTAGKSCHRMRSNVLLTECQLQSVGPATTDVWQREGLQIRWGFQWQRQCSAAGGSDGPAHGGHWALAAPALLVHPGGVVVSLVSFAAVFLVVLYCSSWVSVAGSGDACIMLVLRTGTEKHLVARACAFRSRAGSCRSVFFVRRCTDSLFEAAAPVHESAHQHNQHPHVRLPQTITHPNHRPASSASPCATPTTRPSCKLASWRPMQGARL